MTPRRAVVYVRVSTEDQAENGTSLETQELACLRRAADLGCAVHATFRDDGVSGALYEARDGIQRALAELETGNADTLIVHSISRLSRDLEHQQAISKRVARSGGSLVVCDLPASDTEEGDLMFGITGAFAQYERKLIRRRTMAGSQRVAEKGRQPARAMAPYGYHIVKRSEVIAGQYPTGSEGTYVIDEASEATVRRMFVDYAAGLITLYGIATRLNVARVPTPRGAPNWSMQTISGILKNPVYKGKATWGRHQNAMDESRCARGRQARYKVAREAPTVLIPTPAIVDEVTWQACQERLASNRRERAGNPSRTYLLSAVARCPVCQRGLTGKREYKTGRRLYRCNRDALSAHGSSRYYDAATLEERAFQAVVAAASAPEVVRDAFAASVSMLGETSPDDVASITAALKAVAARERAAATAQVAALVAGRPTAVYDDILADTAEDRRRLEARLRDATSAQTACTASTPRSDPEDAIEAIAALRRVLASPALTNAEKRSAVAGFVDAIIPDQSDGVRVIMKAAASANQKNRNTSLFWSVSQGLRVSVE